MFSVVDYGVDVVKVGVDVMWMLYWLIVIVLV